MQERHTNRRHYFLELADTAQRFYVPYIQQFITLSPTCRVLEVGCGEAGNLLPFVRLGCDVVGMDLAEVRIEQGKQFFTEQGFPDVQLFAGNFLHLSSPRSEDEKFDLIILHDVIEHIEHPHKQKFITNLSQFLKAQGIIYFGFPAWQMPFGGHQQICRSRVASTLPFMHLLPTPLYRGYLTLLGEDETCISELLSIKRASMPIEKFEKLLSQTGLKVMNRTLWFINPHYQRKFGLKPRLLWSAVASVPWVRNFFSTSCFYIVQKK